jgi:large subunit ribosomal protein L5
MARLRERYKTEVVPALRRRFAYKNIMQVPRVEKVVINMRVADALQDQRHLDKAVEELTQISGQRPVITRARRSIAAFKLRTGNPIGAKVTLRGERMYEFLDKLFNISLPRIKDFKGLSTRSLDGRGGMNIGIREQLIFPEIDYDRVDKIRGMDIAIVTTARTDEEAAELLRQLGAPIREGREAAPAATAAPGR